MMVVLFAGIVPRQQVFEGNWGCLGLGLKGLEKEAGLRLVYGC